MNTHPLLRVDKREYLEDLQKGNLFMRSNLYYQKMDCDKERGDIYDGAINGDWLSIDIPIEMQDNKISNHRIVMGNCFIKSFFQYVDDEVEKAGEYAYKYSASEKSQEVLVKFNDADAIMIIMDTGAFIRQFEDACNSKRIRYWYGNVDYMDEESIRDLQETQVQSLLLNIAFIKRKKYSNQQEFRLVVQHSLSKESDETLYKQGIAQLDKSIIDMPFEVNMGRIDDYSVILPLKEFLGRSIFIDYKRSLFSMSGLF